jgi:hypothetical protein
MLKTVSSITNAIGALNYKGTWDANANSPALASSVGTKGDYYVVGTAGTTNLNGISNWGVGDLATFNGSVWQRVEGGADLNGVNLSVSGTSTLSGLTASTALALNASKEIVSVTNTGTGDNVLATTPTLVGDVSLSTGNVVMGTAGKGIADSAGNQQVFVSTNGTGFGAATPAGYKTSTQVNTTDVALSRHYRLKSGGGTAEATMCTETATGVAAATRIAGLEYPSFIIVNGNDGAGNEFMDLLVSNNSGTPTVITSKTTSGAPSVRVYTIVSFNLTLTMASGTYATNTLWFQLSNR